MELFFGGLKNLYSLLSSWLRTLGEIPYGVPVWILILLTAAFFLCLYSSLAAAQTAERRGRAPHFHLLPGFVLPGIYPLILQLVLRPETGSEVQLEQSEREAMEQKQAEQAKAEETALREKQAELERENTDPGYWSRDRVDRVRLRPDGSDAGPFAVCLKDGRKFTARRITGTTPECAVLELTGEDGQTSSLRVPLAQIDSVRPPEQQM